MPAPYSSGRKLAQRGHPGPRPHMRGESEGSSSGALSQGGASSGLRDLGSSLGQCHHPRTLDTQARSAAGPHASDRRRYPAPGCRPAQRPPLASTFLISAQSMREALPREPVRVQASPEPGQPARSPASPTLPAVQAAAGQEKDPTGPQAQDPPSAASPALPSGPSAQASGCPAALESTRDASQTTLTDATFLAGQPVLPPQTAHSTGP